MAKNAAFSDAFQPVPKRRTPSRVTRAPKIGRRTLKQAIQAKVGGLGGHRLSGDVATFIQRSRAMSSEQKAIWHNVTGAGKGHVIRAFFDLSASEQVELRNGLEQLIAIRLKGSA